MRKSAIVYIPEEERVIFETGKEHPYSMETFASKSIVRDIIVAIDNVLGIYFENNATLMFCNVPFEYFEMPEWEE